MPYWFDGNNLIGQSTAVSASRPHVQKAFLSTLNGYRTSGGGRFLVYFDGDDHGRSSPPPGIRVRYSAPLSADDAIVRTLREIHRPEEIIVVSNDRGLRYRCRSADAKTMTWQQFITKMQQRVKRQPGNKGSQQPAVDVDDWMEYFGMKEEK